MKKQKGGPPMKEQQTVERLALSVKETAEALGVSRQTVYRMIHSEGFPSKKPGRRRVICMAELREWMKGAGV